MPTRLTPALRVVTVSVLFLLGVQGVQTAPIAINTNLVIRLIMTTTNSSGADSIRIAKDPRNDQLYYLKYNGDIYQISLKPGSGTSTSARVYSSADHGITDSAQGMAIGSDGTIYIVGDDSTNSDNSTDATMKTMWKMRSDIRSASEDAGSVYTRIH